MAEAGQAQRLRNLVRNPAAVACDQRIGDLAGFAGQSRFNPRADGCAKVGDRLPEANAERRRTEVDDVRRAIGETGSANAGIEQLAAKS
jgi:hypothetical protein